MKHNCAESRVKHVATLENPFQFVDSGLSDVYLVGIKYYTCECGRILAEIPAIKELMQLIARDLIEKPTSLTGEEIRFLRKRLGKKQAELAREIGVEPETFNRYENDRNPISETSDKLLRLYYVAFSGDPNLDEARRVLHELLTGWKAAHSSRKIVAMKTEQDDWREIAA